MNVTVDGPVQHAGVRVNHPRLIAGIKTLTRQGRNTEDICRIIGMPQEVVQKYMREAKAEDAEALRDKEDT